MSLWVKCKVSVRGPGNISVSEDDSMSERLSFGEEG